MFYVALTVILAEAHIISCVDAEDQTWDAAMCTAQGLHVQVAMCTTHTVNTVLVTGTPCTYRVIHL